MTDYFIADLHFGHKNILKYCTRTRRFDSIEEHDQALINIWNSFVTEEDRVFVLGDFFLGGYKNTFDVEQILKKLKGKKILVQGNHDLHWKREKWLELGFDDVQPMIEYEGCLLTHIPIATTEIQGLSKHGRYLINIHGHLHDDPNPIKTRAEGRVCVSADMTGLKPITFEEVLKRSWYSKDFDECNLFRLKSPNARMAKAWQMNEYGKLVKVSPIKLKRDLYDATELQPAEPYVKVIVDGELYWVEEKHFMGVKVLDF